ncbi:MAG: Hachiman antiphage defense system protein HamA [Pseudodesulfovibrio sp.]|uniref:Hachiman antiphage defense system protein HamA n=1 Tax=Pseudodesulfovibrio sp. TaxID=2035812 RepID=UPI003D15316D
MAGHKKSLSQCDALIGIHPRGKHILGDLFEANDSQTQTGVPHRLLNEVDDGRESLVKCLREAIVRHHASPEMLARDKKRREAMEALGYGDKQDTMSRFPRNVTTQKGNLTEIVLAEYIEASSDAQIPVYRLRYNPNVDQAMKGDDILAFDFDSNPVRVIVGESKFRKTSAKKAVEDIVDGLEKSHKAGVPVSLQFVADRLFEEGNDELAKKVLNCSLLFAMNRLQIDYVGFMLSDMKCSHTMCINTPPSLRRLVVMSLDMDSPESIIEPCFKGLEG